MQKLIIVMYNSNKKLDTKIENIVLFIVTQKFKDLGINLIKCIHVLYDESHIILMEI